MAAEDDGASAAEMDSFETDIPARMDRFPWARWHWMVILALGVAWVLDGLEVTIKGAISAVLQQPEALNLTSAQIGCIASFYLGGAVVGAILFGTPSAPGRASRCSTATCSPRR